MDAGSDRSGGKTRGLWLAVLAFGAASNLLMLAGPMFMLQIYDRVLPGRSVETLTALFLLVAVLFAVMAGLDTARAQLLVRFGAALRQRLEPRLFEASLRAHLRDPPDPRPAAALRDIDAVQRLAGSNLSLAVLDLPWTPAFVILLALVHPLLGWLAVGGALALAMMAALSHLAQRHAQACAWRDDDSARRLHAEIDAAGPDLVAGLSPRLIERWQGFRDSALAAQVRVADGVARNTAQARAFRLFLQSAALAAGAWLVLQDTLSAGMMVGASILLGRALAPVEQLAGQWSQLLAGIAGWRRLRSALRDGGDMAPKVLTGADPGPLQVRGLVVPGPERTGPLLRLSGFDLAPGRALGVIGPSGAGKTVLARVLAGAVTQVAGSIRLGDIPLSALPLSRIGYLPQRVGVWSGTIAEAITRHDPQAGSEAICRAARLAGAHGAIVSLPAGYQTPVGPRIPPLPAGLIQRIGLARAFFGSPALVILDEPGAHLDADGSAALNAAIRTLKAAGTIVVVTANRPASIAECDDLLVLDAGTQTGFGPRETILRDLVRRHTEVVRARAGVAP